MSDLISRQAVDDAIYDYSRSCDVNYAQIMEYIDKLPSVENKGEWLLYGYVSTKQIENCTERYCCSKCHNIISRDFRYFNFCPNCGADMRGKAE